MTKTISNRYRWRRSVTSCVVLAVCGFAVRSLVLPQPAAVTAKPFISESNPNTIYVKQEPVGWVFGRVVGFKGADKPMMPHQSFPTMIRPSGH